MVEDKNKETGEEDKGGEGTPGPEKSTAEALIDKTNELSKDRDRLKSENEDLRMKLATKEIGGKSEAGASDEKEFTEEEKASRKRIKAVGDAGGSPWAKNYE